MTSSFVIIKTKKCFQKVQQCLYQQYVVPVSLHKVAVTVLLMRQQLNLKHHN